MSDYVINICMAIVVIFLCFALKNTGWFERFLETKSSYQEVKNTFIDIVLKYILIFCGICLILASISILITGKDNMVMAYINALIFMIAAIMSFNTSSAYRKAVKKLEK